MKLPMLVMHMDQAKGTSNEEQALKANDKATSNLIKTPLGM